MSKYEDLTGRKFGRLTVLRRAPSRRYGKKNKRAQVFWLCQCECGNEIEVRANGLKTGNTRSCGCLYKTHGLTGTPTYSSWVNMIGRCTSPTDKCWALYGGRGIKVCDRWASFENFYVDMGERPSQSHSLDRIDADKDYSPENCRWATPMEQANNRRNSRKLTLDGVTLTVAQWARLKGIAVSTIAYRLSKGWTAQEVLTIAPDTRNRRRAAA